MENQEKLSPVMQQYLDFKRENPEALLLFRLGDFYEVFFDDAIIVSRALDLVLTKRGNEIPMCGVPFHAADNYIARLVKQGFHVAIAEQMETPDEARARGAKQLRRDIVRVLTPGTIVDDHLLAGSQSNFLVAVIKSKFGWSLAGSELSTGDFFISDVRGSIIDTIMRIKPAEILADESVAEDVDIRAIKSMIPVTFVHERLFQKSNMDENLGRVFGVHQNFNRMNESQKLTVGLLAHYLIQTQRGSFVPFKSFRILGDGSRLQIDASTWKSLEIDESMSGKSGVTLLDVIDNTVTAAGARCLRSMLRELLGDVEIIADRQDRIENLVKKTGVLRDWRALLKKMPDIERALSRLLSERGSPRDLLSISHALQMMPGVRAMANELDEKTLDEVKSLALHEALSFELVRALEDDLPAFFREGGVIREGFHAGLDQLRDLAANSKKIIAGLQNEYVSKSGANLLKIKYNNLLGYFIEVPPKQAESMLGIESEFIHKQTLVGGVRFTTVRLAELDSEIRSAAEKAVAVEKEIVRELIEKIRGAAEDLRKIAEVLARIDVYAALAEVAIINNWVRPNVVNEKVFNIIGGRHPVVEHVLSNNHSQFVANDCVFENGKTVWLMTGPNMAGKSTYLRQNAIIVVLAHLGSFVPARSAQIGIVDQLFSRVGASDNLAQGQSTFMVEMIETANILNRATDRSFVILDEIGRGTSTWDGLSMAWAVLEYLNQLGCLTLFATHYHELVALRDTLSKLACMTIEIKEQDNEIIFMHRVISGVANRSYGIHVASMAGVPKPVILRAEAVLKQLESDQKVGKDLRTLTLFDAPSLVVDKKDVKNDAVLEKLRGLDLNSMTPMQALEFLDKLKKDVKMGD